MPQPTRNSPDFIDLQNLCGALGEGYGVVVYFSVRIRGDLVEVIGKSYGAPYSPEAPVQHVALVTFPIQHQKDMATTFYTLAFDLWCQHDGGGATAARRGTPYTWRGYPETPRRRSVK